MARASALLPTSIFVYVRGDKDQGVGFLAPHARSLQRQILPATCLVLLQ